MNSKIEYKIIKFDELPSTNDYAKNRRADGENLAVLAKRQTGGRGTKGRSFVSEEGGIYLSLLRFYEQFPAENAFLIMAGAATAVCETLTAFGLKPCIKWPNDIHVNGKKICGILIENSFVGAFVRSSVVGIGLNVCNALPKELDGIAVTMAKATGKAYAVEEVAARLLERLQYPADMQKYRAYLGYMGAQVELLLGDERIPATPIRVEDNGNLTVQTVDGAHSFSAAEISLRV